MLKTLIKIKLQGLFYRQVKSSKNKAAGKGRIILMIFLFAYVAVVFCGMFGALFNSLVEPLHMMQLDWLYFALMAIIVIMFCFLGSVFITEHEMYEAKDNELLMSMPLRNKDILLSRVCVILCLNYIYEILIAGPAFVIYVLKRGMTVGQIFSFVVVFLTLPLFVLALTSVIAWIVAHVMNKVRKKNLVVLVLSLAFLAAYFYAVTYIEEYIGILVQNGRTIAEAIEQSVFPIYHLSLAIENSNMISLLIYLVCALVPFILVMWLLSRNFIKMATTQPKSRKIKYVEKPMKQQSIVKSLLVREIRHFTSNAMVMLNGAMGVIMTIIGAVALVIYAPTLQQMIAAMPFLQDNVTPILCLSGICIGSLNIITASLISLEGNRLWILKNLPIKEIDILNTKLLLHLALCIPANLIYSIVASLIMKLSILDSLLVIITPNLFTIFIALLGLLMNLWKPKFDWVNETVCVKQTMPVMLTMFISMGMSFMIPALFVAVLSKVISAYVYMYIIMMIMIAINLYLYYLIKTWGVNKLKTL